MPKISIILPTYNAHSYIKEAIESILNQSFIDFELIIINDGSTDKSVEIITFFKDKRIRLIHNKTNLGLVQTLNKGIDLAKGKYIARMDADDISHPQRLEKQLQFLEQNPIYALVGTQANLIFWKKTSNTLFNVETNTNKLSVLSLFTSPFIHPSIMIRTNKLKEFYYNEGFTAAEDYELWTRILKKYPCANLPESLLQYRVHDNNISTTQNDRQLDSIRKIYQANLEHIYMPYTETELDIYLKISGSYHQKINLNDLKKIEKWLIKMRMHLIKENLFEQKAIREVIKIVWYRVCLKNVNHILLKGYFVYLNSELTKDISTKKSIYLFLHTLGNYSLIKPIYNLLKRYFLVILKVKN